VIPMTFKDKLNDLIDKVKNNVALPNKIYELLGNVLDTSRERKSGLLGLSVGALAVWNPSVFMPVAVGGVLVALGLKADSKFSERVVKNIRKEPEYFVAGVALPVVGYSGYAEFVGIENKLASVVVEVL